MRRWILGIALILACIGCDKTADVGGGYTITAPASPDGQVHGDTLYYKGAKVFKNVGTPLYHDGVLVFAANTRDDHQLFAVCGAGPPVMLSERIIDHLQIEKSPFAGEGNFTLYSLENLTPLPDGVRVKMFVGIVKGEHAYETHDLSWAQIGALIQEAEKSEPVKQGEGGMYRRLQHRGPTTAP